MLANRANFIPSKRNGEPFILGRWRREMLENGTHGTIAEIAAAQKINESYCISRYCRSRRVLSKAMLACAAKSLNKEICLSANDRTFLPLRVIIPTISLSLSNDTTRPVRIPAFTAAIQ